MFKSTIYHMLLTEYRSKYSVTLKLLDRFPGSYYGEIRNSQNHTLTSILGPQTNLSTMFVPSLFAVALVI